MDWKAKQVYRKAVRAVAAGLATGLTATERAEAESVAASTRRTSWNKPGISTRTRKRQPTGSCFRLSLFIKTDVTDLISRKGQTR